MIMNKLARGLWDYAKKNNIPVLRSRLPTAEEIRNREISFYENFHPSEYGLCPGCQREKIEKLERDRQYNLQAYQIMTSRQILMSEKREYKVRHKEIQKYLEDITRFEEESKRNPTHFFVRERVAD
jgi:hypothetical protein